MADQESTPITDPKMTGELVIYPGKDGRLRLEAGRHDESLWLTQKQMAELFGVSVPTINEHPKNIVQDNDLQEEAVIRDFRITASDGKRCLTGFYHLDAVISEAYRVNSVRATQLRQGDAE
jgi:hypothetical protein